MKNEKEFEEAILSFFPTLKKNLDDIEKSLNDDPSEENKKQQAEMFRSYVHMFYNGVRHVEDEYLHPVVLRSEEQELIKKEEERRRDIQSEKDHLKDLYRLYDSHKKGTGTRKY